MVLDNASSDGSTELAAAYRHRNIQIHRSEVDLPIWESWHRVWSLLANGEVDGQFMTILGHDDILHPTFLDAIDYLIDAHPTASLYQTPFDMIEESGRIIRPCRPIPLIESGDDFVAARLWGLRDSVGTGYVFRPTDYVAVGGIPNLPYLLYADDLLFTRLAQLTFKAATRDSHCLYRLHRASASHQLTTDRIRSQIAAIEAYVGRLPNEVPVLMNSRSGKTALACFLAREIVLLRPLAKAWLLGPETCQRICRLHANYVALAPSHDYRQWLGTNYVTRDLYALLKQFMLLVVLLRGKLGQSTSKAP